MKNNIKKNIYFLFFLSCVFLSNNIKAQILKYAFKEAVEVVSKKFAKEETEIIAKQTIKKSAKNRIKKSLASSVELAYNRFRVLSKNQYISGSDYLKWINKSGNFSKLKMGYVKNGSILRKNMQIVMGKDYYKFASKTGAEAHHIVGIDSRFPSSSISQKILKKYNIDINDPINGVLLPNNSMSTLKGTIHKGGHTKAYHDEIARRLKFAKNKAQCIEILDGIKNDLLKGKLALYNNHKTNTVFNSLKK